MACRGTVVACLTLCLQLSSFTMCRASNGTKRPYAEDEGDVTDDEIVPVAKKSKPQRAHEEMTTTTNMTNIKTNMTNIITKMTNIITNMTEDALGSLSCVFR